MRNFIQILSLLLLGNIFLSCETTDDCIYLDKRFCDPNFVIPEISEGIVVLEVPISDYDEKVLLEDFTGFRCSNCPPATATAANLKNQHPERLSIVGVHCTAIFAAPLTSDTTQPFHTDFRTPEGEEFVTYFGLPSLPNGVVNRLGTELTDYIPFTQWSDRVNALLSENNPEVYISIESVDVNEELGTISALVYAKPLIPSEEEYIINMSVVEDAIPEAQKDNDEPGGTVYDYIHNHVFRASAYGPWGLEAFPGNFNLQTNEVLSFNLTMDINPIWKLENCELLVFISKSSNREVVQVEETHLQ
jgi:hypothetical protein